MSVEAEQVAEDLLAESPVLYYASFLPLAWGTNHKASIMKMNIQIHGRAKRGKCNT